MIQATAPRTLEQVRLSIRNAEKQGSGREFALLMIRHGRLTPEAREYIENYLK